jgi:hypothetical protein
VRRLAASLYRLGLKLTPAAYRLEFADEMEGVFVQVLERQSARGLAAGWRALGRELRSLPGLVLRLHWRALRGRSADRAHRAGEELAAWAGQLPPAAPDGRAGWVEAVREGLVFWVVGGVLLAEVYGLGRLPGLDSLYLRIATIFIVLGLVPLGVLRGMPRWAYPAAGFLLAWGAWSAGKTQLTPLYLAMLSGGLLLVLAAAAAHARLGVLPDPRLRRIGSGLLENPQRLSFALYGGLPLLLIAAYDHSYAPGQTAALLISLLAAGLGSLGFSRSAAPRWRMLALAGGMVFALAPAFGEVVLLRGALWASDLSWMLRSALLVLALILAPALLERLVQPLRGAVKGG